MNALKHGMTASLPVLPGEDPDAFRRRVADFIAAVRPQNALELALTERAALATWKIARGERAAAARAAAALRAAEATAGLENHDEVAALGHWLLALDLRAKQEAGKALFPFLSPDRHDPFGRGRGEPRHIVLRLEATAVGCRWLIDQWAKLRVWLDGDADWRTNELIAALHLRGQRPLGRDAIEWQGWVEPILPTGDPEAIADLRRRMLGQLDDGLPDDPADQRAALLRLVDEEMERLLERQAGHQRRQAADRAELADRLAVDTTPEGELMRRYQLDNDRNLDRAITSLVKLRRAGVGVTGDPAPEDRSEPEPEAVRTVAPESGPTDCPEGEPSTEVQPEAEGDSPEDEDLAAGGRPPSLAPDPSSIPSLEFIAPAAAVAAGEPAPAAIAAPARAAAQPESRPVPHDERSCPPGGTRPHANGRAQGSSSPAPCSEGPGTAVVRSGGAEGSSPVEPGPPAPGDETPRNEPDAATDGDLIARNEPCAPGGDPIAPNELAGSRRIVDMSALALVGALVILLAAGLSAAWAGPVACPGGRPDSPSDGRSGPAAANVNSDRPGPFASSDPGPRPFLVGRSVPAPPVGPSPAHGAPRADQPTSPPARSSLRRAAAWRPAGG
jgi:hypothetical protein